VVASLNNNFTTSILLISVYMKIYFFAIISKYNYTTTTLLENTHILIKYSC
jgi:hypothetical protein